MQVAEHAMEGSVGRCRHVHNNTAEPLAFGLCQDCYKSYVRASGGNVLGAEDPPAYKRNLRKYASSAVGLRQRVSEIATVSVFVYAVNVVSSLNYILCQAMCCVVVYVPTSAPPLHCAAKGSWLRCTRACVDTRYI